MVIQSEVSNGLEVRESYNVEYVDGVLILPSISSMEEASESSTAESFSDSWSKYLILIGLLSDCDRAKFPIAD